MFIVRSPVHRPVCTPMYGLTLSQSDQRIRPYFNQYTVSYNISQVVELRCVCLCVCLGVCLCVLLSSCITVRGSMTYFARRGLVALQRVLTSWIFSSVIEIIFMLWAYLKSSPRLLAEFRHNRIVQSPHENYFNVCPQHKEK